MVPINFRRRALPVRKLNRQRRTSAQHFLKASCSIDAGEASLAAGALSNFSRRLHEVGLTRALSILAKKSHYILVCLEAAMLRKFLFIAFAGSLFGDAFPCTDDERPNYRNGH